MYDFTSLTGSSAIEGSSYGLVFNSTDLESAIEGFRTLTIDGRGGIGRVIKASPSPYRDGEIFEYSNLPARLIRVQFIIESENSSDLRRSFELLNAILHKKGLSEIKFKDDLGFFYLGSLSQIKDDTEESNSIKGDIEFYCPTPYKYSEPLIITSTAPSYPNNSRLIKLFANISFTASANAGSINIANSLGQIITLGPVVSGKKYDLKFVNNKFEIYEAGIRKMTLLSITSKVELFKIEPGVTYTLSTGGSLSVEFQEVRL